MQSIILSAIFAAAAVSAAPTALTPRQETPCFLVGDVELPGEVFDIAVSLASSITCSADTTIQGVPDVTSNDVSFSSIDFTQSNLSPLAFALDQFATADPLADTDLDFFQNQLNVYLATEAGLRSVGGSLAVKIPKFFLEFQVARIQTAQGNPPTEVGLSVEHKLGKVLKLTPNEDQDLIDKVNQLAVTLS